MRVGFVTQFYDPEPGPASLPGVLARGLVARGHSVQVVTGFPNYPSGRLADGYRISRTMDEVLDGVRVRRVAMYPSHDSSTLRRMANHGSFSASAVINGASALRGMDAAWVNCSPVTLAWPMWAARRLGIPLVSHVLDLWPDTLYATTFGDQLSAGVPHRVLNAWANWMYQMSHSVAYISPSVGRILADRGVPNSRLHYVPMWTDEEVFHPGGSSMRAELALGGENVVLLYAGALGDAQGLFSLLDACALVSDPRFVCVIAGSGTRESGLRAHAQSMRLTNVRFLGRLPQARMTDLMATADASYIGLRPHGMSPYTLPSKTQAALASGKAIVAAARGDAADVVTEAGAGFTADPGSPVSIAHAIERLCRSTSRDRAAMGEAGRRYYLRTFSVERGVDRIEELLSVAAQKSRSSV